MPKFAKRFRVLWVRGVYWFLLKILNIGNVFFHKKHSKHWHLEFVFFKFVIKNKKFERKKRKKTDKSSLRYKYTSKDGFLAHDSWPPSITVHTDLAAPSSTPRHYRRRTSRAPLPTSPLGTAYTTPSYGSCRATRIATPWPHPTPEQAKTFNDKMFKKTLKIQKISKKFWKNLKNKIKKE